MGITRRRKKMKRIVLCIFLFTIVSTYAQDVIVLRDATEIESKVLEISETSVKYKKWGFQDGPIYTIGVEKIFYIKFDNGEKEVFNNTSVSAQENEAETTVEEPDIDSRPFIKGPRFHAYPYFGYYVGQSMGIDITWSFGIRIFDYAYFGPRIGFNYNFDEGINFPIQWDFRGYIPINRYVHPYLLFSPGLAIFLGSHLDFACHLGVGFDIGHFSFNLGYYNGGVRYGYGGHNFFLRIGAKIGRKS